MLLLLVNRVDPPKKSASLLTGAVPPQFAVVDQEVFPPAPLQVLFAAMACGEDMTARARNPRTAGAVLFKNLPAASRLPLPKERFNEDFMMLNESKTRRDSNDGDGIYTNVATSQI
jgi:hypothetical protein